MANDRDTHTHTRLTALCPVLPGWAGTRKVKPIWILLKQETVSGSGISWAICESAPCSRQITTPASRHSVFYRSDALSAAQPTASKHWRHNKRMTETVTKWCPGKTVKINMPSFFCRHVSEDVVDVTPCNNSGLFCSAALSWIDDLFRWRWLRRRRRHDDISTISRCLAWARYMKCLFKWSYHRTW